MEKSTFLVGLDSVKSARSLVVCSFCQTLINDIKTTHIPILLSAAMYLFFFTVTCSSKYFLSYKTFTIGELQLQSNL